VTRVRATAKCRCRRARPISGYPHASGRQLLGKSGSHK